MSVSDRCLKSCKFRVSIAGLIGESRVLLTMAANGRPELHPGDFTRLACRTGRGCFSAVSVPLLVLDPWNGDGETQAETGAPPIPGMENRETLEKRLRNAHEKRTLVDDPEELLPVLPARRVRRRLEAPLHDRDRAELLLVVRCAPPGTPKSAQAVTRSTRMS